MTEKGFDVQDFARGIHELLVLSSLQTGEKHGYQIALDLQADSNDLFRFKHGTLYPILHRLEGEGLIKGSWSKDGGRRKKVYSLTGKGRKHLSGETGRVQEIVSGLMRLLPAPSEVPA
ncbi:MAG: helix-turn-helix transcriptional regulator [Gemmatimonadota bacterium]|nr:helix-turn-helix transcriptional regulator [Gemmatimonadota bacterium]